MSSSRWIACFVLLPLIGGCGFQLAGAVTTPAVMERTYIAADDRYSLFYRALKQRLVSLGVHVVDSPVDATATLSILIDDTNQRVLSVSARNVPTEYEVYYTVQYSLSAQQSSLLEPQVVTLTRDYTYDETLVLGKVREEALMRESIVDDLVRIVVKQISSL